MSFYPDAPDVAGATPVPLVTFENLNLADLLILLKEVILTLETNGFVEHQMSGHYNFVNPKTTEIVTEAAAIEALLKSHGLDVSPKVDQVIQMLPVYLPLLQQFLAGH